MWVGKKETTKQLTGWGFVNAILMTALVIFGNEVVVKVERHSSGSMYTRGAEDARHTQYGLDRSHGMRVTHAKSARISGILKVAKVQWHNVELAMFRVHLQAGCESNGQAQQQINLVENCSSGRDKLKHHCTGTRMCTSYRRYIYIYK